MKIKKFLFILILCFANAKAQQVVTFNFDKSSFEEKPSYLEPVTIEGYAIKNITNIDIIRLTVKSVNQTDKKNLDKYIEESKKLKNKLTNEKSEFKFLNELKILDTNEIEKIYSFYKGIEPKIISRTAESILIEDSVKKEQLIETLVKEISQRLKDLRINILDIENEIKNIDNKKSEISDSITQEVKVINPLWIKDKENSKFQFFLLERLNMEEHYTFIFELFTKHKTIFPLEKVFERLDALLDSVIVKENGIRDTQIREYYKNTLRTINNDFFSSKLEYDSLKKDIVKQSGVINTTMEDSIFNYYKKLYVSKINYNSKKEKLIEIYKSLVEKIQDTDIWKNMSEQDAMIVSGQFKSNKLDTIVFFNFIDKFKNTESVYKELINLKIAIRLIFNDISKNIENIEFYKSKIDYEIKKLKDSYVIEGIVSSSLSSSSIETDIDGIKISTSYGILILPLGFSSTELSFYVALHYRLGAFDNRLSGTSAYKSRFSHFSIMTGIATTSNLKYKGEDIQNTRIGIKPMVGFSYEPIKRLNLSIGIIAFLLKSPGVQNDYSETKFRPFVSIAFDFDAINSLIHNSK